MAGLGRKVAVGLDVGQTATKLVALAKAGRKVRLVHAGMFSNRDEGILTEDELGDYLGPWLEEQGYHTHELVVQVPQYMAIAQLADFPRGAKRLDEMVAYETQHLASLSDEEFLHGYARFEPFSRYANPVLIGVCREMAVRARLAPLASAQLHVADMVMEGHALARTYRDLIDFDPASEDLHVVLDLGAENTTMAFMVGGQTVHLASLLFGGDNFTRAIARHLNISEAEAEKTKLSSRVMAAGNDSPPSPSEPASGAALLAGCADELAGELRAAKENWEQQGDGEEAQEIAVAHMYVAGGGILLEGLDACLAKAIGCPVDRLRIEGTGEAGAGELFAGAYGQALHALPGRQNEPLVSLAPKDVLWQAKRRKRQGLLVLSTLILAVVFTAQVLLSLAALNKEREQIKSERRRLERCRGILPELKDNEEQVDMFQQMLVPFAAVGNRSRVFVTGLNLLSKHRKGGDWILFVADHESLFLDDDKPAVSDAVAPGASGVFGRPVVEKKEVVRASLSATPWRALYAAGFTPHREKDAYRNVRETVDALNGEEDTIFGGVDIIPEAELPSRNFEIRRPWLELFRMRPFTLRMPLSAQEFEAEGEE